MNSTRRSVECFRPLSGSYISQLRQEREENLGKWQVSVPYRGATFLNWLWRWRKQRRSGFRPLSGSYISQLKLQLLLLRWRKFPSPIGELHFSIANKVVVRLYEKVSVPYRGATFLNQYEDVSKLDGETVSVPYRGATFLNIDIGLLFPVAFVSVPYRGATFLNKEGLYHG